MSGMPPKSTNLRTFGFILFDSLSFICCLKVNYSSSLSSIMRSNVDATTNNVLIEQFNLAGILTLFFGI